MERLCVFVAFDTLINKPRYIAIKSGENDAKIIELFKGKGSKRPLSQSIGRLDKLKTIIESALQTRTLITSDFKYLIELFNIDYQDYNSNVYDLHITLPPDKITEANINRVVEKMYNAKPKDYQRLISDSSIVYSDLQRRGVDINHIRHYPKWSIDTFSGRSKNVGVNIQGWSENDLIRPPGYTENDYLIHFDWICADIRIASIMSGDKLLQDSFYDEDPYEVVAKTLRDQKLSRNDAKTLLLKSINSMDFTSEVFTDVYKDLGRWIFVNSNKECTSTILGRNFHRKFAKNNLALFNATMQGSVVHAMQSTIKKVWDMYPSKLLTEVHDSLVVCASQNEIKPIITSIAEVMAHPFSGFLDANPFFPLKISIGKKWKKWKEAYVYRESTGLRKLV